MRSLLIIGAGGHGEVVCDIAENVGQWKSICFLDDNPNVDKCLDYDVVGTINDLNKFSNMFDDFVIAIGDNTKRMVIYEKVKQLGLNIPSLIHPSAIVSRHSVIGKGSVIMANAVVNANTVIGEACIINTGCVIEHDCSIGCYVHISPKACITGTVYIDDLNWIGANSTIKNNVHIGKSNIIGAGSVVLKDIANNMILAGNPATVINLKEKRT